MKLPQPFEMPFPAQANEMGRFKRPARRPVSVVDSLIDSRHYLYTVLGVNEEITGVTEQELFEMANISPVDTGLARRIWISANPRGEHHRPRLKVEGTDRNFYPVSLDEPVEFLSGWAPGWSAAEFKDVQRFVALNRELLLIYWNDQIDTKEALGRIRSI